MVSSQAMPTERIIIYPYNDKYYLIPSTLNNQREKDPDKII